MFRTAHELAMKTVAIYSYEDRMNAHRYKVRVCVCARDASMMHCAAWLPSSLPPCCLTSFISSLA